MRRTQFVVSFFLFFTILFSLGDVGTLDAMASPEPVTELVYRVSDVADSGILVLPVNVKLLARAMNIPVENVSAVELELNGKKLVTQFALFETPSEENGFSYEGNLIVKFDEAQIRESRKTFLTAKLQLKTDSSRPLVRQIKTTDQIEIGRSQYKLKQAQNEAGTMPTELTFVKSGKKLTSLYWQERLYDPISGVWSVRNHSPNPIEIVSDGPLATVVRTKNEYVKQIKGKAVRPKSEPVLIYNWLYLKDDSGLVQVVSIQRQKTPFEWSENHLLELHFGKELLTHWLGGKSGRSDQKPEGTFRGEKNTYPLRDWVSLYEGNNSILFFGSEMRIHDTPNLASRYFHHDTLRAWKAWNELYQKRVNWLRFGELEATRSAAKGVVDQFVQTCTALGRIVPVLSPQADDWEKLAATTASIDGLIDSASGDRTLVFESRDLGLILCRRGGSDQGEELHVASLFDRKTNRALWSNQAMPFFTANVLDTQTGKTTKISSMSQWQTIRTKQSRKDGKTTIVFTSPKELKESSALTVELTITADAKQAGLAFGWSATSGSDRYSFDSAVFPSFHLGWLGRGMKMFYPLGCGVTVNNPIEKSCNFEGPYPTAHHAMPWCAVWDTQTNQGLYCSFHDSFGSSKTLRFVTNVLPQTLTLEYEHILPNRTVPNNKPSISGECVLRGFQGDWYNAALIYRDWVRAFAKWYPEVGPEGRVDSSKWFKELPLWCRDEGVPAEVADRAQRLKEALGVPCAMHWYRYHVTPFDNDYPHFIPTKEGFKEAVAEIEKDDDFVVMPYINGRLWDTKDRGMEDWLFTKQALAGATKDDKGALFTSRFGEEADHQPCVHAIMCPTNKVWQDKIREMVLRLMNDYNVQAVYIDQVSASRFMPCMDRTHGHTLGGGTWWTDGYWTMLDRIRKDMKRPVADYPFSSTVLRRLQKYPDMLSKRFLTSECNSEVYAKSFDAFLVYHFNHPDQVPAFHIIYSGAIQCFGRYYRRPENTNEWKLKVAQSLAYGEQIGWFMAGDLLKTPELIPFVRDAAQFRYHHAPWFYKGEMGHPPVFIDPVPELTLEWKCYKQKPEITETVVQAGLRALLGDRPQALLYFSNTSKDKVVSRVRCDLSFCGLKPGAVRVTRVDSEGKRTPVPASVLDKPIEFPAQEVFGYIIEKK
ncbi:MAG: DUF6259 domain-containing protein [Thermoguttaceae bacterium]|nr:DUF6259 domain-containing protein [Thermoguttaceae bacterium]